jgi:hypothetical protein
MRRSSKRPTPVFDDGQLRRNTNRKTSHRHGRPLVSPPSILIVGIFMTCRYRRAQH